MNDPAIDEFFIKEKITKEDWLPKASKQAESRAFSTHPSTYSHPDTGVGKKNSKKYTYVTPITCNAKKRCDGFLRSGNTATEESTETLGNAAALKIDRFLKMQMKDGLTLLEHLKADSNLARSLLTIEGEKYDTLRINLLGILKNPTESVTSGKIKQVYFPIQDSYHLLSILTNSGILFKLKKQIRAIKFPENIKEIRAKKKNNEFSETGFTELYNITAIGYGGSQPQNISALNIQNYGEAHVLLSMPPILKKRNIRFPKKDFFSESLYSNEYREIFHALHKLFRTDYNNHKIREGRDYRIQRLMDLIVERMWAVRSVCDEQYMAENSRLSRNQKVWLCEEFSQVREDDDTWLEELCKEISRWIVRTYERLLGKSAYKLGEQERLHFHNIITENREALK